jgi:hypothetical protein
LRECPFLDPARAEAGNTLVGMGAPYYLKTGHCPGEITIGYARRKH